MLLAKIMHTIFDLMAMEGWVEEEICTRGVSNGQNKERVWGGGLNITPITTPSPTTAFISKSNMAG